MDNLESIFGVISAQKETMELGLKHGEEITLSKLTREINRMLDLQGLSGEYNRGFREALILVRAYIHLEMGGKP